MALALGLLDVEDLYALPEWKLENWRKYDRVEPIGPREIRIQLAELLAMLANRWRGKNAATVDRTDFLLQTVADVQKRNFEKMVGGLAATARVRPPGFKRKRPKGRKRDR